MLRELLTLILGDLRGLRVRALLLVGFEGALQRSELAAIRVSDLVRTERGYELTLMRSKGAQTSAVLVPLPEGKTELCAVWAHTRWVSSAAITERAVYRRISVQPRLSLDAPPCPARDRFR